MVSNDWIEEFRDLYPFKSRFLDLDGLSYHYLDEGQGENLLLLHGNPTWSFYYRNLIKGLRHQYRCVAPDHMGCGLSSKPRDYPYTLSRHIDNVSALVEALQLNDLTLVMHDWGGAIGMGYAVRHPEKIKRLVLFNTAAFLSDRLPWSLKLFRNPQFGPFAILRLNAFARGAAARGCVKPDRMRGEVRRAMLAPYNSPRNRIANLRFVQDIPMGPETPSHGVVREIESNLLQFRDLPCLIIWGMKDFVFTPHFLDRWRDFFPDAEVHEMDQGGHYVVEDTYEDILPILLRFLATPHPVS